MPNQIGKFILSILLALFLVPTFRRSPSAFWYWAWYVLLVIFCVSGTGFGIWLLVLARFRTTAGIIVFVGILLIVLMPLFLIRATTQFNRYRHRSQK